MGECAHCGCLNPEIAAFCTGCGRVIAEVASLEEEGLAVQFTPVESMRPEVVFEGLSVHETVTEMPRMSLVPPPGRPSMPPGLVPPPSMPPIPGSIVGRKSVRSAAEQLPDMDSGRASLEEQTDPGCSDDDVETGPAVDLSAHSEYSDLPEEQSSLLVTLDAFAIPEIVNSSHEPWQTTSTGSHRRVEGVEELSEDDFVDDSMVTDSMISEAIDVFPAVPSEPETRPVPPPLPPPLPADEAVHILLRPIFPGGQEGRLYDVTDELEIGSDFAIIGAPDDFFLSQHHARFERRGEALDVVDLDSENGVWFRLRGSWPLQSGDMFMCGGQVLRFENAVSEQVAPVSEDTKPMQDLSENAGDDPFETLQGTGARFVKTRSYGVEPVPAARLVQCASDGSDRNVCYLRSESCRIGRHIADFVFTEDPLMSATHAMVFCPTDGPAILRDLGSRNGTWIRLRNRMSLDLGDAILIGSTIWRTARAL